jgi:hypothetical protein
MPLLYGRVLSRSVQVAQTALQRRAFIDRAAAGQREARIGDPDAGGSDPYPGLRALGEKRLVPQGSGERVTPMACDLDLMKRPRRSQIGGDTAELELENFRLSDRRGGSELLPAGIGVVKEVVHGPLGHAHGAGAMQ